MLDLQKYRSVVVLTGAGISVASGLKPYRGPGGLWTDEEAIALADAKAWAERPDEVWRMFSAWRAVVARAAPNAAHKALAAIRAVILTQNVDGLHQRAGSKDVVELHGRLRRTRCTRCALPPFDDDAVHERTPSCPACGAALRPDVVLFDEALPVDAERRAKQALRDCDLFLAVGTSGTVWPASSFVRGAKVAGARTIWVNVEPSQNPAFDDELIGPAEELLPRMF
jgi:NAD-dependent deacetylase